MRKRASKKFQPKVKTTQPWHNKTQRKTRRTQNCYGKIRFLVIPLALIGAFNNLPVTVRAITCPDLRVVFARGSGGERWTDQNYLAYKESIESKLKTTSLSYEFIDLDYPAVAVGVDNLAVSLGALIGAGEAYEFGDSVNQGANKLVAMVNDTACPQTQYVVGGYSQGAMVVSKSLRQLIPGRVIYAATFGDPKLYLPEGEGIFPVACRSRGKLSDYRMYVPDCQAYKGLLGAYMPYEPEELKGKVGTWCNRWDIFCSSHFSISHHTAYVADNLYEDASRVIFDKITKHFGIESQIASPHDTAILIDSTGSMSSMIKSYKNEALRLAKETLESGGRVALYDYRDLADPYEPVQHCDFNTCTLEVFQTELDKIYADGGGDTPESLLSASLNVMKTLQWQRGATKSIIVLTDADFISPDLDGTTLHDVVQLSKTIDPVNFYIITDESCSGAYEELAAQTDGKVVTNFDELSLLTDYILERYDSLPRVEEQTELDTLPTLQLLNSPQIDNDQVKIDYTMDGESAIVIVNDAVLGITDQTTITLTDLNAAQPNTITLVPIKNNTRGEAVSVTIDKNSGAGYGSHQEDMIDFIVPKAPDTGKASVN